MSRLWAEKSERLFVACAMPDAVRRALAAWQLDELESREGVRVNAALHVTLCFLGDVRQTKVPDVVRALRALVFEPFALTIGDPVFLPQRGAKRVIALAVEDASGALTALQADVSATLAGTGLYKPEKRPYMPHLTVARFRRPGPPFSLQNVTIPEFGVDRVVLYSSLLEGTGAVHTPVAVFPASRAREERHLGQG